MLRWRSRAPRELGEGPQNSSGWRCDGEEWPSTDGQTSAARLPVNVVVELGVGWLARSDPSKESKRGRFAQPKSHAVPPGQLAWSRAQFRTAGVALWHADLLIRPGVQPSLKREAARAETRALLTELIPRTTLHPAFSPSSVAMMRIRRRPKSGSAAGPSRWSSQGA